MNENLISWQKVKFADVCFRALGVYIQNIDMQNFDKCQIKTKQDQSINLFDKLRKS